MNSKVILIVLGEPNSIFSEVLFKYFKSINFKKNKNKIVLVGCKKLFKKQMKYLNYNFKTKQIYNINKSSTKLINIINVNFRFKKTFSKITSSSNQYIEKCFNLALKIAKTNNLNKILNGPVSKKHFLKKQFPGITEYISFKTSYKKPVMLIYNDKLAVCPLTTHIPIKNVSKHIKKDRIIDTVNKINKFYETRLGKMPRVALLGLNPHCESTEKKSEEDKEIIPAIRHLTKKKIRVFGPFSADTFFLNKNIKKFDVVIGMYHDQVLAPIKTLFKFNAINVTIGLPFVKVTPDHGPNEDMIGKNKSDPSSIFCAMRFLRKIK